MKGLLHGGSIHPRAQSDAQKSARSGANRLSKKDPASDQAAMKKSRALKIQASVKSENGAARALERGVDRQMARQGHPMGFKRSLPSGKVSQRAAELAHPIQSDQPASAQAQASALGKQHRIRAGNPGGRKKAGAAERRSPPIFGAGDHDGPAEREPALNVAGEPAALGGVDHNASRGEGLLDGEASALGGSGQPRFGAGDKMKKDAAVEIGDGLGDLRKGALIDLLLGEQSAIGVAQRKSDGRGEDGKRIAKRRSRGVRKALGGRQGAAADLGGVDQKGGVRLRAHGEGDGVLGVGAGGEKLSARGAKKIAQVGDRIGIRSKLGEPIEHGSVDGVGRAAAQRAKAIGSGNRKAIRLMGARVAAEGQKMKGVKMKRGVQRELHEEPTNQNEKESRRSKNRKRKQVRKGGVKKGNGP